MSTSVAYTSSKQGKIILTVSVVVNDFETWKKAFNAGEPVREKAGIKIISIATAIENPNLVLVVEEADSFEIANNFINLLNQRHKEGDFEKLDIKLFDKEA